MGALDGFRMELDPHPSGHEVVLRAGEVRAYFRNGVGSWKTEQREQVLICGPRVRVESASAVALGRF
jgi:hypothetical protein